MAQCGAAGKDVANPIVFNDNGGWSWFEGERVVYDASRHTVLLSSVANSHGRDGTTRDGDIDVVAYNLASGSCQRVTLSKHLQPDDHDSAALLILPDGRYLASYSKHASDNRLHYRITEKPGDITNWRPEQTYLTTGATTYSNLSYLSKPNTIFNFYRDRGRGFDPNFVLWKLDVDRGFANGRRLLTGPEGNSGNRDRPYLRYVDNGFDRIHFIATEHHPRNLITNSIYHGFIEFKNGKYTVCRSDGSPLGDLSNSGDSPYKANDFTTVFLGDHLNPSNNLRMTRAWPVDIELARDGNPSIVFTARVDDNDNDHRFFYGRFSGHEWYVQELARAGSHLYQSENDYTGLAALDPNDPNHVYISTTIDPSTLKRLPHYELFEGRTNNQGNNWSWSPVTRDSNVDNIRPVVPRGTKEVTILIWMRGTYKAYTNYSSSIVGIAIPSDEPR